MPVLDGEVFWPFKNGVDVDDNGFDLEEYEQNVLDEVDLRLWGSGGFDEGAGGNEPENCRVEMYVAYFDCGSCIDLLNLLQRGFTGHGCGPNAEAIALTHLRNGIDEIIEKLKDRTP